MAKREVVDHNALWDELLTAGDRAIAILAGAYVEQALLSSIIDKLSLVDKIIDELTGNGAPLGTFSNKIMLAKAIGVIGPVTRKDLDRIRKIRNLAAHSIGSIDFSSPATRDLIRELTPRMYVQIPHDKPFLPEDPRKRFIESCEKIAMNLEYELPREAGQTRRSDLD